MMRSSSSISSELRTIKDALEHVLPDWTINDDLEAVSKKSHFILSQEQMDRILSLGLVIIETYRTFDTVTVTFAPLRRRFL